MKITTREGKAYIKITGDLSIASASELKDAFIKSFEKADMIQINLDTVTNIDFACLQLLSSASITANKRGKTLSVKNPSVPIFEKAIADAGFKNSNSCSFESLIDSA